MKLPFFGGGGARDWNPWFKKRKFYFIFLCNALAWTLGYIENKK